MASLTFGTTDGIQDSTDGAIKIIQWNLGRCKAAQEEALVNRTNADILLLQEPYTGNTGRIHASGVTVFQTVTSSEQVCKAAVIVCNPDINGILLSKHSDSHTVLIRINTDAGPIAIGSMYIEPDHSITPFFEKLRLLKDDNIIIGGDLNAKNVWWGSARTNRRGEEVADFLSELDLHTLNEGNKPTFETFRGHHHIKSVIDMTFCSPCLLDIVDKWRVETNVNQLSDHNPIFFEISTKTKNPTDSKTALYNTKKANWEKFSRGIKKKLGERELNEKSFLEINNSRDLETKIEKLMDILSESCAASIPIRKPFKRKPCPWWNAELDKLKKEAIRCKHRLQNSGQLRRESITLPAYLEAKQAYKIAIINAKTESWKNYCAAQNRESAWSAIHRVLINRRKTIPLATLRDGSEYLASAEETAQRLMERFFPDDDTQRETREQVEIRRMADIIPFTDDDPSFTEGEIEDIMSNINPDKAPGEDHFTADICLHFFNVDKSLVTGMYNACLRISHFPTQWKTARVIVIPKPGKDDLQDIKSYRPIGLISVFGKVLEKVIINRINWHFHRQGKLSLKQFGFTPQKSTEDALNASVKMIKAALHDKKLVAAISLDIRGAFDNAWWPFLMCQLSSKRCPRNLFMLVKSYHHQRRVKLSHFDAALEKVTTKGCVQGSSCGPSFWNYILDDVLQKDLGRGVELTAFADDLFLIAVADTTIELARKTDSALETITKWGSKAKLNFAEDKTNAMFITRRKDQPPAIHMNGVQLKYVDHFKVLGLTIDRHLNWSKHVDNVCKKAAAITNKLVRAAKPTWGASPEVMQQIYLGAVEPLITYASSVWADAVRKKVNRKKLDAIQRHIAIRSCKGYRTISLVSAQVLSGFMPLDLRIRGLAEVYEVKKNLTLQDLPSDRYYQGAGNFYSLPHPAERNKINHGYNDRNLPETERDELRIFTDGSLLNGKVGAAFVPFDGVRELPSRKLKLDDFCSVFQAELLAIREALVYVLKKPPNRWKYVSILTDCKSGVHAITDRNSVNPIVMDIRADIQKLRCRTQNVYIGWIRGHCGILGNEKADEKAREATLKKTAPDFAKFPLSFAKKKIKSRTLELWNDRYVNAPEGSITKMFFPTIFHAFDFRRMQSAAFELTQILTGHGGFMSYLHRFKLSEIDTCPCDDATPQDVPHLLMHCPFFSFERMQLEARCRSLDEDLSDIKSVISHKDLSREVVSFMVRVVKAIVKINKSKTQNAEHSSSVTEGLLTSVNSPPSLG
jgi:ribonuclease HI